MRSIKKLLLFVMASVMIFAQVACSSTPKKYVVSEKGDPLEYNSIYFDFLGGKDVMPIGGFFGPYKSHEDIINCENFPDYFSDDIFSKIHDCGVNAIVYYNTVTEDATKKLLEQGEKYGVGIFAKDSEVNDLFQNDFARNNTYSEDNIDLNAFQMRVNKWAEHDSFLGLHIRDEAFMYHMDELKGIVKAFDDLGYKNKHAIANALGYVKGASNVYTEWQYAIETDKYFDAFADSGLTSFSTTFYPFDNTDESKALIDLLDGLSANRMISDKYDLAFWRMLQAGSQWNDAGEWIPSAETPYPTEGQMILDINAALAYGAKAIQYFPLIQPTWFSKAENYTRDYDRNALIAANGELTRWYYYAKKANKQIAAVDHVLMNSKNVGVIVSGADALDSLGDVSEHPEYIDGSFRQLKKVSGGSALVGCFDYNGGTALYAVNFSTTKKNTVNLSFDDKYAYEVIQRAKSADVYGNAVNLTLEAGEGALIVLK